MVIKNFQHQLLTDVETTNVKSLNINIDFPKPMLSKLHHINFVQNQCCIIKIKIKL